MENKIYNKKDILVFVDSKKSDIIKKLKKRSNFNTKLYSELKKIQFTSVYKKKRSNFIIKNNFKKETIKREVKRILAKVL